MIILRWNGALLFTSSFFLQCYEPQQDSFKIDCDLYLIKAIDLHYRHRIKIFFVKKIIIEKTCAHLELKETKNIADFLLLKVHPH